MAQVRTRFGEEVVVHFYLDEQGAAPAFFDWSQLRPGHTMCILYPHIRNFMDMTRGVRQEDARSVMVFLPADFATLRNIVQQDWIDAMMAEQRSAAVREMAAKYSIEFPK